MRGLGAWRHVARLLSRLRRLGTGGAVAEGEDVVVAGGLQGRADHQLVDTVAFQAAYFVQELRCLDARRPDFQAGRDEVAVSRVEPVRRHFADRCIGQYGHSQVAQCLMHRLADTLGQRRQHPRAGFDQRDVDVLGLDPIQAVGCQLARRMVKLGGEFDAGRSCTDDGHADGVVLALAGVRAHVMAEQLAVEAFGLGAGIEENAVFRSALGAEVVGGAADGDHQGVVIERASRYELVALLVERCGEIYALVFAVQTIHAAHLEFEVVPLRLGDVVQLVLGGVERAGGDFVQQGFPDVGEVGVDQGDLGLAAFTQGAAETGGELQPAGAAADDHDAMCHGKDS